MTTPRNHAVLPALLLLPFLAGPAAAQYVTPPKDSGLTIDNVVPTRPAKVVMNMDHNAISGRVPTGIYYMQLIVTEYRANNTPLDMVAIFHDAGGYMVLNDAAYNRYKHARTGNPWKAAIAALQKQGVAFELCAFTAYNKRWVNADLLPGVKVDNDVLLRLINLTQDGFVQIQP
ncbi:MAG: DsrE family protein [Proteobacteria bacterium]|nr:DsrE family protein [Pseudomonadota bacterium]